MADSSSIPNPTVLEPELLAKLQPGLARLMPEIGARFSKAYYAAQAGNWPLAQWQLKEMRKLFQLGNITRPKYQDDVEEYLHDDIEPLFAAVESKDFAAFARHFTEATDAANEWHRRWKKSFIVWKLPDSPPSDLDYTPQENS